MDSRKMILKIVLFGNIMGIQGKSLAEAHESFGGSLPSKCRARALKVASKIPRIQQQLKKMKASFGGNATSPLVSSTKFGHGYFPRISKFGLLGDIGFLLNLL